MSIERTEEEWRRLLASMRVAGSPDPAPERSPFVRRVVAALWDALERQLPETMVDVDAVRRAIRIAPEERSYLTHLLGLIRAPRKAAA